MWISRKEFDELKNKVDEVEQESDNHYRLCVNLCTQLKQEITNKINNEIGIKVIKCAQDEIRTEVFNKLKNKLFDE